MYASKKLFGHKYLEIQLDRFDEWSWFEFYFKWNRKTDHAGIELRLELLGFVFILTIYDNRHWDYDNDKWKDI